MLVGFTLDPFAGFAPGGTVSLYPDQAFPSGQDSPIGAPLATAATAANGTTTFTGLTGDTNYWAVSASGRRMRFRTPVAPAAAAAGATVFIEAAPYKADGSGAGDCSAAFNQAIADLAAIGGGTIVGDLRHTYKVSSPILFTGNDIAIENCEFKRGGTNTILSMSGDHAATTTTRKLQRPRLRNVVLDGNGAAGGSLNPLIVNYYCAEGHFENVKLSNYSSVGISQVEAWDNHFYELRSVGGDGDGNGQPVILIQSCDTSWRARLAANFLPGTDATMTLVSVPASAPGAGTVTFDNGYEVSTVAYTGKTATTLTGCTLQSGNAFQWLKGQQVWGPPLTTGFGHSTDNSNNTWIFGLYVESFRDGGVWVRGTAGQKCNKLRFYGAKIESRSVRDRAHPVYMIYASDVLFAGLDTDLGEFDTTLAGVNQPVDHVRIENSDMLRLGGLHCSHIPVAAASSRTYLALSNNRDISFPGGPKFEGQNTGGQVNPVVSAIEWHGDNKRVDLRGLLEAAYSFNPAGQPLVSGSAVFSYQPPQLQSIPYAAAITPDVSLGAYIKVGQLTGNISVANPVSTQGQIYPGQAFTLEFQQDATGSRTITFSGSQYRLNWTASIAGRSTITFVWNGTNWIQTAGVVNI